MFSSLVTWLLLEEKDKGFKQINSLLCLSSSSLFEFFLFFVTQVGNARGGR